MTGSPVLHPGTACLVCRHRKTKCDGVQPVCGRCHRLGKTCEFESDSRRPRTERLQEKILFLENEIDALRTRDPLIAYRRSILGHRLFRQGSARTVRHLLPIYPFPTTTPSDDPLLPYKRDDYSQMEPSEAYVSVLPRTVIEAVLLRWDPTHAVPPQLKDYLVRLFLPYRGHYHFMVEASTFLKDLQLPESHPRSVHPALANVIYLIACSIGGGYLSTFEPVFLSRARNHLEQSLAYADRLIHFLWASILLGQYFTRSARKVEAYNTIASTVRFAIGCRLDSFFNAQILGNGEAQAQGPGILPVPANKEETIERTSLWGAIYLSDRVLSDASGLPSSLPPEATDNVHRLAFGRPSSETSPMLPNDSTLFRRLAYPVKDASVFDLSRDNNACVKVKTLCLLEGIQQFATSTQTLAACQKSIPLMSTSLGYDPCEYSRPHSVNPSIFAARILFYAATIVLHGILAERGHKQSCEKMIIASCAMADLARLVRSSSPDESIPPLYTDIALMAHMYHACEILVQHLVYIRSLDAKKGPVDLRTTFENLETLMDVLADFAKAYPAWGCAPQRLKELVSDQHNTPSPLSTL